MLGIDKQLRDTIISLQERYRVPGIAVGIVKGGVSYGLVNGITNIDNPVNVDETTLFQIASITKTFNAMLALRLSGEGKLDLNRPIIEYLPDFQMSDESVTKNATVTHLLTHTGGWEGDIFEYPDKGEDSLKECMRIVARLPQLTPLGTIWAYNPVGFYILGRVFESIVGKPYEQIIRDYVLTPLAMNDSVFSAGEAIVKKAAVGHYIVNNTLTVATPWEISRCIRPGGGLISSLSDMMTYLRYLLMRDSGAFPSLPLDAKEEMFRHRCDASGPADAIGLAWMIRYIDGIKIVRHGGASMGQYAEILFVPEEQFGFVLLSNGNEDFIASLSSLLAKAYLGIDYKRSFPEPIAMREGQLRKYKGLYEGIANDIEVLPLDDRLEIRYHYKKVFKDQQSVPDAPAPMSAVFYAADRAYIVENNVMCDFFSGEDGTISFLRHGNRIHAILGHNRH